MIRSFALATVCAALFSIACPSALAQDAGKKPTKTSKAKAKAKPKTEAVARTPEPVSPSQLEIAARVLTGDAQCEFDQRVSVQAIADQPGHFKVGFKKATYTMVPQETTTGAVRLEDKQAGVMWLQIPSKSMLMNSKIGQRMVDSCTQVQQRAAS